MKKLAVTKLFLGSLAAIAGGLILGFAAVWAAYANGVFVMNGAQGIGIEPTPLAWTMIGLAILSGLALMGGAIGQFMAWIGARLNTIQQGLVHRPRLVTGVQATLRVIVTAT